MKIRHADINDLEATAKIHYENLRSLPEKKIPEMCLINELDFSFFLEHWNNQLKIPDGHILVLEIQNKPIGFVYFGPCKDKELKEIRSAEIHSLYVDPSVCKKGYGAVLYLEAEKLIKNENYQAISVKIIDSNYHAKRFYEKLGFISNKQSQKNSCLDIGPLLLMESYLLYL